MTGQEFKAVREVGSFSEDTVVINFVEEVPDNILADIDIIAGLVDQVNWDCSLAGRGRGHRELVDQVQEAHTVGDGTRKNTYKYNSYLEQVSVVGRNLAIARNILDKLALDLIDVLINAAATTPRGRGGEAMTPPTSRLAHHAPQ